MADESTTTIEPPVLKVPEAELIPETKPETVSGPAPRKGGFWWGTGRRKTAVARVRVRDGSGLFVVNGKECNDFFRNAQDRNQVRTPLQVSQIEGKYDVFVRVAGGGMTGQAGAVKMGLARALCQSNPILEAALRDAGQLTRDSRMKERKKYGQRGARRRFQFSKR